MAKDRENLALGLLEKHSEAFGLSDAYLFDSEDAFFDEKAKDLPSAVVFLPKSRGLIDMALALASGKVAKGGTVALVGENKAGIGSAKKHFEAHIGPVEKKEVGNHSALYVGKNERLSADKKLSDFMKSFEVEARGAKAEIASLPGVFSDGELDQGTALLLESLPLGKAQVLDVGCGAGVIGAIYKKLSPESQITACDMSPLALMAAKETSERNGTGMKVLRSDVFDAVSGKFDLIVSNPPFHTGIATDYSFIEKFARGARSRLAKGGEVYIVANSFLSYKEKLESNVGPTELIAEDGKFSVWRAKA